MIEGKSKMLNESDNRIPLDDEQIPNGTRFLKMKNIGMLKLVGAGGSSLVYLAQMDGRYGCVIKEYYPAGDTLSGAVYIRDMKSGKLYLKGSEEQKNQEKIQQEKHVQYECNMISQLYGTTDSPGANNNHILHFQMKNGFYRIGDTVYIVLQTTKGCTLYEKVEQMGKLSVERTIDIILKLIHFLLATQTLRKIYESSALTKGTLEEMHIRIALQCLESELISLIGDENAKKCIRKVEKKRGAGIYLENDIVSEPVAMQVAYVETEIQNRMLDEISKEYQEDFNNQETNMFVFRGNDSPGLKMKDIDHCDDKVFLLGEKIGMGDPVSVEIGIRRKTDMLVVGENVEAVNNATRLWIAQTMKKTARSSYNNIYVFDGSLMIDETAIVNETLSAEYSSPMVVVDNVFSVLHTIDLLYDEYISRKRRMMQGNKTDSDKENIYVVISNYQWIEPLMRVMENENLDEFMPDEIMEPMTTEGTKSNSLDLFEQVNSMMDELNQDVFGNSGQGTTRGGNNISYNKKMMSMLTSGYYCGMHFYLSCTDVLALNRLGQKDLSVFRSRILFRTLARDVYKIMDTTINIEGLGDNMAVYSDGINSPEIFRPYNLECDER